ncbi:hypothetical protein HYY69_03190 [Candidatus Woesearchaeota archaeon]|nr:hypothetical protein [Candidatus Woesearchaeota archaeon]
MKKQEELALIKERNKRVEADKAWETSLLRRVIISILTYIIALLWLLAIDESKPYAKALIPVGGYVLSTLVLSPLKTWWLASVYKK